MPCEGHRTRLPAGVRFPLTGAGDPVHPALLARGTSPPARCASPHPEPPSREQRESDDEPFKAGVEKAVGPSVRRSEQGKQKAGDTQYGYGNGPTRGVLGDSQDGARRAPAAAAKRMIRETRCPPE